MHTNSAAFQNDEHDLLYDCSFIGNHFFLEDKLKNRGAYGFSIILLYPHFTQITMRYPTTRIDTPSPLPSLEFRFEMWGAPDPPTHLAKADRSPTKTHHHSFVEKHPARPTALLLVTSPRISYIHVPIALNVRILSEV